MPQPDKDYSKGITFSPDVPSLCDDGRLLIGSMNTKPMKGSDVKSDDSLYYTSLGNSKNITWGDSKESCELAEHVGKDGTAIYLNFESWSPTPEQRCNNHKLSKAIAEKADDYFKQMTSPSYIDYRMPETMEDCIRTVYSTLDLKRHIPSYVQGVSPRDMVTLAMVARAHPGVDVRITEAYKELQRLGRAPQVPADVSNAGAQFITPSTAIGVMRSRTGFGLSQDIADASRKDGQLTSAAGLEAAGPSNTQPEETSKVTQWLRSVEDPTSSKSRSPNTIIGHPNLPKFEDYNPPIPPSERMVTDLDVASQPDGAPKGPRIVDQDSALADQHTAEDALSHPAQLTSQNIADNLTAIQVPVEAITPPVSSVPLASPVATASRKRRREYGFEIKGLRSPVSSISD
ncbi:hypothetical protein DIS24_g7734 [Lasiodiplodia hormozganensis]|uniref:Uncharacterized protein n=1 Tax=Lasiodiplodia hormozganensis TaxID=869390 RepID=A0AA40CSE8_9PEZI|nr:hypothetical protein DIS24_g7734 [Lasiodiplodia hormozganensis]